MLRPTLSRTLLTTVIGAFSCFSAELTAQSAQLTAVTPVTVTAQSGAQTISNTLPAGPLPASSNVQAVVANVARVLARTEAIASTHTIGAVLDLDLIVPPAGMAELAPCELTLDLANPTTDFLHYTITRELTGSPGMPMPTLSIDVQDDGTPDFNLVHSQSTGTFLLSGNTSIRSRIQLAGSSVVAGTQSLRVTIQVTPATATVTSAGGQCTLFDFGTTPRFDGGVDVQAYSGSASIPAAIVLGLGIQPQILGTLAGGPCLLLPRPDALVLLPQGFGTTTIPVPQAVRPLRLYTQAVMPAGPVIATSQAYSVYFL